MVYRQEICVPFLVNGLGFVVPTCSHFVRMVLLKPFSLKLNNLSIIAVSENNAHLRFNYQQ